MTKHLQWMTGAGVVAMLAVGAVAVQPTTVGASDRSTKMSFYEKNTSLTYTTPSGVTQDQAPAGPPAPNSQIEFTDLDYPGTAAHHKTWTASDHFMCQFNAQDVPTCQGQIAIGGSMLLIKGTGGQGTFTIPVVGGTGLYQGATGSIKTADIGQTLNANLVVSVSY